MSPNLFNYATSELSQDAFICWLLAWAKPEYKHEILHQIATKLIGELTGNAFKTIHTLEIKQQYKNIDILVIINEVNALLIEDKVHALNYNNQLTRYAEAVKEDYKIENTSLVYFKTGDQSSYKEVVDKNYTVYRRIDFLRLLKYGETQGVKNDIFLDFFKYLSKIEEDVKSYKKLRVGEWIYESWKGFYLDLQARLKDVEWKYIPQKNGGFLGFWWYRRTKKQHDFGFDYYLQFEPNLSAELNSKRNKLCFKLHPHQPQKAREIRDHYRSLLYAKARQNGIEIYQNGRIGKYMTVAALSEDVRQVDDNGIIDMAKTVREIRKIEKMLDDI